MGLFQSQSPPPGFRSREFRSRQFPASYQCARTNTHFLTHTHTHAQHSGATVASAHKHTDAQPHTQHTTHNTQHITNTPVLSEAPVASANKEAKTHMGWLRLVGSLES